MIYRLINIPIFLEIGEGILNNFDDILKKNNVAFIKPVIITGNKSAKVLEKFKFFDRFQKYHVSSNDVGMLYEIKSAMYGKGFDLIIAAGGGRIIDSGKFLSLETTLPMISVPTILSSDSVSSPISILRVNGVARSTGTVMPTGVIIDLDIIKNSPIEYLRAGLGDLTSNLSASNDWELAYKKGYEKIDNFARMLALLPAERMLSKLDFYENERDIEFLRDLSEGLVLSGVSMGIAGSSRPASGSEHNIGHSLDRILGRDKKLHGIQVGVMTLFTLHLQGSLQIVEKLTRLYRKMSFPTKPQEIGIHTKTLKKAVRLAPSIRDRYTILNEFDIDELVDEVSDFFKNI